MFEALVVSVVAEVAKPDTCAAGRLPVMPLAGTFVAVMLPEPLVVREAPLPTVIAAVVLVPEVSPEKAVEVEPVFVMV
jgi:hypothetical protein